MARDEDDAKTGETAESAAVTPDAAELETDADAEPTTVEQDAVASLTGRAPIDRRSLGIGAAAVVALVLAFLAGAAVGGDDHDDERVAAVRGERMFGGGHGRPRGGDGPRFDMRHHGRSGAKGARRGGGFGGPGSFMGRGGHGGAGVVESVSDDKLTIAPLAGRTKELVVRLGDDTKVTMRGDDGPHDIEEAKVSDIDEGDIVMVLGKPGDGKANDGKADKASAIVDARAVFILRNRSE